MSKPQKTAAELGAIIAERIGGGVRIIINSDGAGGWHPTVLKVGADAVQLLKLQRRADEIATELRAAYNLIPGRTEMTIPFLIGALVGTFLISRLFWAVTKTWPDSVRKAVFLNVVCAAIIIPLDYSVRDDAVFIDELVVYGACQALVLLFDVYRLRKKQAAPA